jgi:hypothetical protein
MKQIPQISPSWECTFRFDGLFEDFLVDGIIKHDADVPVVLESFEHF